jgi:hypothetical protein
MVSTVLEWCGWGKREGGEEATFPNSALFMTFSATAPGSAFHGEDIFCWIKKQGGRDRERDRGREEKRW